jgi:hypothetical protein
MSYSQCDSWASRLFDEPYQQALSWLKGVFVSQNVRMEEVLSEQTNGIRAERICELHMHHGLHYDKVGDPKWAAALDQHVKASNVGPGVWPIG